MKQENKINSGIVTVKNSIKISYDFGNEDKLKNLIITFSSLIQQLNENNIVLGGSVALFLHGINMGNKKIDDLDIIIYNPTQNQEKQLKLLHTFNDNENMKYSSKKIYKFQAKGLVLNIILEKSDTPKSLLNWDGFKIQSIQNVINAKNSYIITTKSGNEYLRKKDIEDLMNYKESNFNLKF